MAGTAYVTAEILERRTRQWLASAHLSPARRRPLPDLSRAALLVVDVQRYFAAPTSHAYLPALAAVLPRITALIEAFRTADRPVVLTRHGSATDPQRTPMGRWWRDDLRRGEERAALLEALEPERAGLVLDKAHYSAFHETELQGWLTERGCDVVVVAGVMTHLCCETSARDAFIRGLQPVVVADACASATEELHVGALRGLAHGFAVISPSATVLEALAGDAPADARQARSVSTTLPERWTLPERCELAVVGAGPAGLAAAIQAQRAGLAPLLLEASPHAGGLIGTANLVENYPGFPGGLPGDALRERFVAQAEGVGVEAHTGVEVTAIAHEGRDDGLALTVAGRPAPLLTRAAIVATGTEPRALPALAPLAGDPRLADRLDALGRLRGRRLLVVGGGEAAFDQALLARRRGAEAVTIAVRGPSPRAMSLLVDRAARAGVELLTSCVVAEVTPRADRVVALLAVGPREELRREVDAVLCCVGRRPRAPALPEELGRDAARRPLLDADGQTSVAGLYLVGDLRRGSSRQVGIAVGDGLAAAMHAARLLAGRL